jgi:glucosyl-dolichyl phosphate glucuronosyltransferase
MRASVIIPSCGRPITVVGTVRAVLATNPLVHDTEIVVVDNNSEEQFSSALRAFCETVGAPVRYVVEPSPGVSAARHRGAREAQGELLLFIDDDVEVALGWLPAILEAFQDEGISIVGGPSIPRFLGSVPSWLWDFVEIGPSGGWCCSWISLLDVGKSVETIDADWIWSLNLSIRRDLFVQVGGQHPCYVPPALQRWQGDGELGLTSKCKALGARASYVHEALIHHLVGPDRLTLEYFGRRAFYQGVCDSFTAIREGSAPSDAPREPPEGIAAPWTPGPWTNKARPIRQAVAAEYQKGWAFHQREAMQDPSLLEWIGRKDFWEVDIRDQVRLRELAAK